MKHLIQLIATFALAAAACVLLLYQPPLLWFIAAAVLAVCYIAISSAAPRNLSLAYAIAALAPLSYTGYIFYLLATVEAERPAEAPTYFALAGYYLVGVLALGVTAWLSRKRP